jgi:hypothetical protein
MTHDQAMQAFTYLRAGWPLQHLDGDNHEAVRALWCAEFEKYETRVVGQAVEVMHRGKFFPTLGELRQALTDAKRIDAQQGRAPDTSEQYKKIKEHANGKAGPYAQAFDMLAQKWREENARGSWDGKARWRELWATWEIAEIAARKRAAGFNETTRAEE